MIEAESKILIDYGLQGLPTTFVGSKASRKYSSGCAPMIVFDVPLLVESGRWRERVDYVWVVDCDEAVQVARVAARPGWSADAARAVIARQASRGARRAVADAVIANDGTSLDELARSVQQLWRDAVARRP